MLLTNAMWAKFTNESFLIFARLTGKIILNLDLGEERARTREYSLYEGEAVAGRLYRPFYGFLSASRRNFEITIK